MIRLLNVSHSRFRKFRNIDRNPTLGLFNWKDTCELAGGHIMQHTVFGKSIKGGETSRRFNGCKWL